MYQVHRIDAYTELSPGYSDELPYEYMLALRTRPTALTCLGRKSQQRLRNCPKRPKIDTESNIFYRIEGTGDFGPPVKMTRPPVGNHSSERPLVNHPLNTKHLYNILYNAGLTSKTLGRRCTNVIQMFCACWAVMAVERIGLHVHSYTLKIYLSHWFFQ